MLGLQMTDVTFVKKITNKLVLRYMVKEQILFNPTS